MQRAIAVFLLISTLIAHNQSAAQSRDSICTPCRQQAGRLLDEALTYMRQHYYRRDFIQWDDLASAARSRIQTANEDCNAKDAISWCFSQLNERHSFVMSPDKAARYNDDAPPSLDGIVGEIKGEWLQDSIAYISIPWISTTDSLLCMKIADSLQTLIARLDTRNISRWIIDLRKNSGGNCWPMLAGIGPLLGDGVHGFFVGQESRVPISYRNGIAFQGRSIGCRVSRQDGYHTRSNRNHIAVLTGRKTVSAGEIVAMAFKGKEQTLLLGEPTAGLTTANATYSLSDHSMLVLSICREADHTGRIWEGPLQPDRLIPSTANSDPSTTDPVMTAAIDWLLQ